MKSRCKWGRLVRRQETSHAITERAPEDQVTGRRVGGGRPRRGKSLWDDITLRLKWQIGDVGDILMKRQMQMQLVTAPCSCVCWQGMTDQHEAKNTWWGGKKPNERAGDAWESCKQQLRLQMCLDVFKSENKRERCQKSRETVSKTWGCSAWVLAVCTNCVFRYFLLYVIYLNSNKTVQWLTVCLSPNWALHFLFSSFLVSLSFHSTETGAACS